MLSSSQHPSHKRKCMKLARCQLPVDERATQLGSVAPLNAGWVRFGGEVLLYAEDTKWNDVVERAQQQSLRLQEHSDVVEKNSMHLVIQNGRCFQQERPEAQVLFDKGRYLVVALDPEEATQIDGGCVSASSRSRKTRGHSTCGLEPPSEWPRRMDSELGGRCLAIGLRSIPHSPRFLPNAILDQCSVQGCGNLGPQAARCYGLCHDGSADLYPRLS
jgi:hypothetical protein